MRKTANLFTVSTLFILLLSSTQQIFSQKFINIKPFENKTLVTIGSEKLSFMDLKKSYDKNSMRNGIPFEAINRDSALDFLEVFTKYKLKVIDGRAKGYDKDTTVVNEINRNKRLLAESFLFESDVIEPKVQKYTQMRKVEKKIAVIMTNFAMDGDTTEAYKNITNAIKEIQNGTTFEDAASKYSADSASAKNGGVLPIYITGMKIQKVLEDAIYKLKVGEYTKSPIKTGYGYFLIKLIDEQPRIFLSLKHILIPFQNSNEQLGPIISDSTAAKKLADSLYLLIEKGEKFEEIAEKFSSDKATSVKNGELGTYSRSTGVIETNNVLEVEIEEAAFALRDAQVSKPVISQYGYHLIKRDSVVVLPEDFEKDDIKNNYRRLYFNDDRAQYIDSLAKNLCNFTLNNENFLLLLQNVDTMKTAIDTNFKKRIPNEVKQKTLYHFDSKDYSIEWFANQLTENQELRLAPTNREGLNTAIKKLIEPAIIDKAAANIDKTHPQFNMIIGEFSDGIVLFKSEQANVWEKLKFDTSRAKTFYDTATSAELIMPAQYDITEIFILDETKANEILTEIKSNKISFDSAAGKYTQRNAYRSKNGNYGFIGPKHPLAQKAINIGLKVGENSDVFKYENGFSIIKLNKIQPERKKTFEEALPSISTIVQAEYQKQLEQNWINQLKKDYKVVINEKLFDEIYGKKK